jgi:hypothetical protein
MNKLFVVELRSGERGSAGATIWSSSPLCRRAGESEARQGMVWDVRGRCCCKEGETVQSDDKN